MAYNRYRRSGVYTDWGEYHSRKRAQVAAKYGGIDQDVRNAFFNLDASALQEFFSQYKKQYGSSASAYARKTYAAWKAGQTEPSAQTSERLLEVLPNFLTLHTKCDLLRKLREHHRHPESHELTVSVRSWREAILPLVDRIIHRAYTAELPEHVASRLQWLSSGSMQVANALMAEAEAEAAKYSASFLSNEFENIERLIATLPARKSIQHSIQLPYGTISVKIDRSKKMDEQDQHRPTMPPEEKSLQRQTPSSLLQNALSNLDPEQVKKLSETAAAQAINIEVEKVRADRRFEHANRDMNNFIDQSSRLDRSQASDYTMQAGFESASGRTDVKVSKQSSKVTLAIAVMIAVLLLILFASRH